MFTNNILVTPRKNGNLSFKMKIQTKVTKCWC